MVLVTTLVTIDDDIVSCDLIRPSRSSPPRMPQRLWGTKTASGAHVCVDRCAFFIGFSIGNCHETIYKSGIIEVPDTAKIESR